MKKPLVCSLAFAVLYLGCSGNVFGQKAGISTFPLNEIRLLNSPFLQAQQTDLRYILALDQDRLLAPFLREAGLKPKAQSYGNWENSGLDGHTAGHYLTALAQMYASAGSAECKKRLDYMVSELARCQQANGNGYVGGVPNSRHMWATFKNGDFSEFNKEWVPWYNLHKLFAGLRDAYLLEANQQAKEVFIRLTDWAANETAGLSDSQMQTMLNMEHGGMNEVIADAYAITGDKKYLALAKRFSHNRILLPLEHREDRLTGLHANTQIPKVIGFERIAELSNDTTMANAVRFFWRTVVKNRSISIGGNSVAEHFNPADNFESMLESEQGPETCNSNNMLKLSKMIFLQDQLANQIGFYERLLYNHILSSQHPIKGGFVYFTPIHPQHYRVYSTPQESFWCCVGTGMENHGKYGELIYTHQGDNVYVNLFIPSVLNWKEKGFVMAQENKFPQQEASNFRIIKAPAGKFALYIRKPVWVKPGGYMIRVNGKIVQPTLSANGYARVERNWKPGDQIQVALPMQDYTERLPDHSQWISFIHGPIVLAAPTDSTNTPGLFADGSRWAHIAGGPMYPLVKAPVLISNGREPALALHRVKADNLEYELNTQVDGHVKQQKLIPFYAVHDTRYMLYWPVTAGDSLSQLETSFAVLDENYIKLAPRTIDRVSPGEQQPENDHKLDFKDSQAGILNNVHFRTASGYFSYQLRHTAQARYLRIAYFTAAEACSFDILVNGSRVGQVKTEGTTAGIVKSVEYPLPAAAGGNDERFLVEFVATNGLGTAPITDVRILKQ
ncbi:glycoside hydrolase family 127 protein [Mucilaginibacter sp. SMC90]|uniref:glycoside hydrolase family 127 protein n=1 Tax=Mucilaginibacter sp. SMC90 TaxID=2929803 RepID=UPI001FB3EA42|nr:glycoside hydrolase family 127 protein [Mucilaginibacter sp. SMC90]UOE52871.1 glycoside hydrolase family 127 protein [Mucilaginibacter sp. SMC90]